MSPGLPIEVERSALVGVIQTSSERDHNSEAGRDSFQGLGLDWVEYEFYDENTVPEFFRGVKERRFTAVCFGSNALFNPVIHTAACAEADCVVEASQAGMGIVLLHQFLPDGALRECKFLPTFHQLDYRGAGYGRISRIFVEDEVLDGPAVLPPDRSAFGDREPVLWATITPLHPGAWCSLTRVEVDGQEHVALMRTRASRGRIIASALPLDWMSDRRLLKYAIGLSVRSLGTLYIRSAREPERRPIALGLLLGRSLAKGGHLTSVTVADPGEVSSKGELFRDFSHLVVSEEWGWPELTGLTYRRIQARLENGGSVAAYGSGESAGSERVLSIVSGRPVYLQLAHQFAAWKEANMKRFADAPATQVRALAVAVRAVTASIRDPDEIPLSLALEDVDGELCDYYAARLRGTDNVDGHVLPTASVASAMQLLSHPEKEITPLRSWIERGHYVSSFAAVQQAALWLPELHLPLDRAPKSDLEVIYQCLLAIKAAPGDSVELDRVLAILKDPDTPVSRRAIIAEALVGLDNDTLVRAAGAARQLQNDLNAALAAEHAPLAVICLLMAFLIRVHAVKELTTAHAAADPLPAANADELHADLRGQLKAQKRAAQTQLRHAHEQFEEQMRHAQDQFDQQRDELLRTRAFGTKAASWAVWFAITLIAVVSGIVVSLLDADWPTWIAVVFLPVLAGVAVVLRYVGSRASTVECEPRLLHWIRQIRSDS